MRAVALGVALNALAAAALSPLTGTPTRTVTKRHNNFVSVNDGKFHVSGKCVRSSFVVLTANPRSTRRRPVSVVRRAQSRFQLHLERR